MRRRRALAGVFLLLTLGTVGWAKPASKGDRVLAMTANLAADQDFDKAFKVAQNAGVQSVNLGLHWDEIETSPGVFAPPLDLLALANSYYPPRKMKLNLELLVINTNHIRLPKDLMGRSFDDPVVLARFQKFLNYVLAKTEQLDITALAIGNEVDIKLGNDRKAWKQYETFFKAAVKHVHQRRPRLRVGCKATFNGYTKSAVAQLKKLNRQSDVVMVNHYLIEGDFGVRQPREIHGDFAKLVKLYPGRTIYFSELGFPSSKLLGSSEAKQAEFIRQAFQAWDTHRNVIKLVEFVWLFDESKQQLDQYEKFYGSSNPRFRAFLASLGLRHANGKAKAAFHAFKREAKNRGWGP